jgi:hypothetical protein
MTGSIGGGGVEDIKGGDGGSYSISSFKLIGGSIENLTWRDVRRRVEPSSNWTSYDLCGSTFDTSAFRQSGERSSNFTRTV